ncbi:MAG: DsbA family oxidoreductase [Anaerolineales bacterium]|nr:DsbA family oxidoreductase [Anaerolineales bacterium]
MDFKLTIFSDYICPWCYVGQGVLDQLNAEHNVDVEWRPYYLRPDTPPEGMDLPDYILKARANGSEERLLNLAKKYGMDFRSTDRIYNTRIAHEATEYARERGKVNEFHKVVFRKVYADGYDISQWDVLRSAAEEVGLDADDMQSVVDSGKYTAQVAEQVNWAQQIGVTGVPTYVINDRYAIVGAQPYEAFKNALAQIADMKDE